MLGCRGAVFMEGSGVLMSPTHNILCWFLLVQLRATRVAGKVRRHAMCADPQRPTVGLMLDSWALSDRQLGCSFDLCVCFMLCVASQCVLLLLIVTVFSDTRWASVPVRYSFPCTNQLVAIYTLCGAQLLRCPNCT